MDDVDAVLLRPLADQLLLNGDGVLLMISSRMAVVRHCTVFGSWPRALAAAGVDPAKFSYPAPWSRERVIEAILTRALRNEPLLALQQDSALATEKDRVDRFVAATGCSRATYFRMKAKFNREV